MNDGRARADAARAAELYAVVLYAGRQLRRMPDPNRFNPYHSEPRNRHTGTRDLRGMFPA